MARITSKSWNNYISILRRLSDRAAAEMLAKITEQSELYNSGAISLEEYRSILIDYGYALATKYGEGAGAAACEMYDAISELQGANVPPAVPANTCCRHDENRQSRYRISSDRKTCKDGRNRYDDAERAPRWSGVGVDTCGRHLCFLFDARIERVAEGIEERHQKRTR